jgi:hypothetical protein
MNGGWHERGDNRDRLGDVPEQHAQAVLDAFRGRYRQGSAVQTLSLIAWQASGCCYMLTE